MIRTEEHQNRGMHRPEQLWNSKAPDGSKSHIMSEAKRNV